VNEFLLLKNPKSKVKLKKLILVESVVGDAKDGEKRNVEERRKVQSKKRGSFDFDRRKFDLVEVLKRRQRKREIDESEKEGSKKRGKGGEPCRRLKRKRFEEYCYSL